MGDAEGLAYEIVQHDHGIAPGGGNTGRFNTLQTGHGFRPEEMVGTGNNCHIAIGAVSALFDDGKGIGEVLLRGGRARLHQDPFPGNAVCHKPVAHGLGLGDVLALALAAGKGGWFSHISRATREEFRERLSLLGMGLEDRMQHPVGLLSGGQRQALTLMMATFNPPKLLLLDEHTAALDPATAEKVLALTKDIVEKNALTCLMVTHNMQTALDLGNRTLMMDNGRVIYDASGDMRSRLNVDDLLILFREAVGKNLDNDRMMLG